MRLSVLLRNAGYGEISVPMDMEIRDICSDTRMVTAGSLFVALRGTRIDSHFLLDQAAENGAACAVVDRSYCGEAVIRTVALPDTREALSRLWDAFLAHPAEGMTLIGVTGTNGKTTVSHLLSDVLSEEGMRVGRIGTVDGSSCGRTLFYENVDPEAHMTTPDPYILYPMLSEMRQDGCEIVVMEATSHASALKKLAPLRFDLLIFTNLTEDHLDFHKTPEAYFEAKAALTRQARRVLVNLDNSAVLGDPYGYAQRFATAARESGAQVFTCSAYESRCPDFLLSHFQSGGGTEGSGTSFRFFSRLHGEGFTVNSPLLGGYNGMNLLEGASAAFLLGASEEAVKAALRVSRGAPGRMERVDLGDDAEITVLIDFAHTPDALENLLKTVRGFRKKGQRLSVLFGCGGDRDRSKRREMAMVASRLADLTYITSDNSRSEDPSAIIKDILKGIDKEKPYRVVKDRREAIEEAILQAKEGEILLLCGKGHEQYQIDRNGIHDFCESDIARRAYRIRKTMKDTDHGEAKE